MKYIVLIICLILFVNNISSEYIASDSDVQDVFKAWAAAYKKSYTSEEFQTAFQTWKVNFNKVVSHNSKFNQLPDVIVTQNPESNSAIDFVTQEQINPLVSFASAPTVTLPKSNVQMLSLNYYADISYSDFVSKFTGGIPPETSAASSAVLSVGAIVGIAVGGGVAVAAITVGIVVAIKKKRSKKTIHVTNANSKSDQISSPVAVPPGSTNIFHLEPPHHSITARLFEVKK
ncbi:hypothetical protein PPL_11397 [Heterostelium album PN500]|uniref:Cathepsin propeptide inhibitor domain-containing protein n=1 Tax=Heterostelium pallidum (strain ATCC 26659 / Pp 5 / PN500) TaxID=670386 RepID=D3BTA4_HETP5|nr:hypothetical protein PPL_11397 [Heterostelium album PN500]EFA75321.1 hypothetical protein PPL_11397 [Heterostelium album PN500]|eukprot:XP_020427455.1 hypothetical protein PPL_11397 [Heterostelium album PN500]